MSLLRWTLSEPIVMLHLLPLNQRVRGTFKTTFWTISGRDTGNSDCFHSSCCHQIQNIYTKINDVHKVKCKNIVFIQVLTFWLIGFTQSPIFLGTGSV